MVLREGRNLTMRRVNGNWWERQMGGVNHGSQNLRPFYYGTENLESFCYDCVELLFDLWRGGRWRERQMGGDTVPVSSF